MVVERDRPIGIVIEDDRYVGIRAIEGNRGERIGGNLIVLVNRSARFPAKLFLEARKRRLLLIEVVFVVSLGIGVLGLAGRVDGALVARLSAVLLLAREEVLEREEGGRRWRHPR